MNIGKKIRLLKERSGLKDYQEFGRFVDLNGEWCLELSKKTEVVSIDVTRLIKIANKFNVTLDWLLSDDDNLESEEEHNLPEGDIAFLLKQLKDKVKEENSTFEGTQMNSKVTKLACDSLDVVRQIIKQNLI